MCSVLIRNYALSKNTQKGSPTQKTPPAPCGSHEYECRNGECINLDFLCDNQKDCIDGSDEDEETCISKYKECMPFVLIKPSRFYEIFLTRRD